MDQNNKTSADYNDLALEKLEQGYFEEAMTLLGEAAKLYPGYFLDRGQYYYDAERYEDAIADYTSLIKLWPDDDHAYVMRALAYFMLGKFREAILDRTVLIHLFPQNADHYFNRAEALWSLGEIDQALEDYTKAVNLNMEWALFKRAHVYEQIGQNENSLNDFQSLIDTLPPSHPHVEIARTKIESLK